MADSDEDETSQPESEPRAKAAASPRVVRPPELQLHPKHRAELAADGIYAEQIARAELYTEHNAQALAKLLNRRVWLRSCGSGLVFPCFLPGATSPYAHRVKPSHPRTIKRGKKERLAKYESPDDSGVLVYFPPLARAGGWYQDTTRALHWTEGEKKGLVLDQIELACVALTGVWNFTDTHHRVQTGEERLHAFILEHVAIAGRAHVIVFDADSLINESVMLAAGRLAGLLRAAGATSVMFVCPPSAEHKGIDDYFAAHGEEATRALLASAQPIDPIDPASPLQRVRSVKALREAPVAADLRIPDGYEVQRDGSLWRIGDGKRGDTKIAASVILPQRYLDDYYTRERRVDVCYERDGAWSSLCVGRRALVDARTMVSELGAFGAPVTSNSAARLVDWLEDAERVNAAAIPRVQCVSRAGWHTIDGERVFVLNEPVHADAASAPELAIDTRGERRRMFSALAPRGGLVPHVIALREAFDADPILAAVICAALAATLLEVLGAPNFALHLIGDSSRGKTSMIKCGASVFGDPTSENWVANWNTTQTAAEIRAAALTDLPQFYDEIGSADPTTIERLVYMIVNGGGRSRGQRDLTTREPMSWRTVLISTGERELADHATATGAQVRVIHMHVNGIGELDARGVDALRESCSEHAGQFGRTWVESLVTFTEADRANLRADHREFTKQLRELADNPLQARLAGYFATLGQVEVLLSDYGIGSATGEKMRGLFKAQRGDAVEPLANRAAALIQDWRLSEPESFPFIGGGDSPPDEPSRTRSGRPRNGFAKDGHIFVICSRFRSYLADHRMSPLAVLREWLRLGWLRHEVGRLDYNLRIGSGLQRVYALRTESLPALQETDES